MPEKISYICSRMTNQHTCCGMQEFRRALKAHGLKATSQRITVHEAMMNLGHACADDVCRYLGDCKDRITVASVYNILAGLAECGIYRSRLSSNNKMYFDVDPAPHIHLYDEVNHSYMDVTDDEFLSEIREHFRHRRFKGYKVSDVEVQIVCHPTRRK